MSSSRLAHDLIDLSVEGERYARGRDGTGRQAEAGSGGRHVALGDNLLSRVALALNSTLELRAVLHLLAELVLDATSADRCSLFLLDGTELRPVASIGARADLDLWEIFRQMGPVELDTQRQRQLREGRAVVIPDARRSDIVPRVWTERFALRSLVLVPLLAIREPCGLMVVERADDVPFPEEEVLRLEAIGSYAGIAVRNARLFEATRHRARLQEALARGAAALASPTEPPVIIERLVAAFTDLLGASACGIGLFDEAHCHITAVASQGVRFPDAPIPFAELPATVRDRLTDAWMVDPWQPVRFDDEAWFDDFLGASEQGATWYLVLPIPGQDRTRGAVLLGFDGHTDPDPEALEAAKALSAVAAAILQRSDLLERLEVQVHRLEVLYGLSAALAERADATALVGLLNGLLDGYGVEVVGMAFRDRRLRRHLGGENCTAEETAGLRGGADLIPLSDGSVAVPMRLGKRVAGTLRVRPADLEAEERSFVEALASGVGQVASRGALRTEVEEAARDRAVGAERDRIAADLHDTVGQHLVGIALFARRCAEALPADSPWYDRLRQLADLAEGGKWEINQAIRALAFVPAARRGLVPALRALTESFESDSGIVVVVDVVGRPVRLTPVVERALYRVANEALTNAWRHARCSIIRVEVAFERTEVALSVHDDGVGLEPRGATQGINIGISAMRRAMAEAGGRLRVRNARPHGVLVEARVSRERR